MTEFERNMVSVACTIVDALKDIDERLQWLEGLSVRGGIKHRHDLVWEDIELGAKTLKLLNQLGDKEESDRLVDAHGETCNCETCRVARGGERI